MRRDTALRHATTAISLAAAAAVLGACGSGGSNNGGGASASNAPTRSQAALKALTPADVPAGLTLATVAPDDALIRAAQAVESVQQGQFDPAACRDKSAAAQVEVRDTVSAGSQQTLSAGQDTLYAVTLLPSEARMSAFEAAATGECAQVKLGSGPTAATQTAVREPLPASVQAQGFILRLTRTTGEQKMTSASAYFAKDQVVALVNANPRADGTIDEAQFTDLMNRVANKI